MLFGPKGMLLPQPNDTYRVSRRYGLEGFERFLDASISRIESPTPVRPIGTLPESIDDLARITERSTEGGYWLMCFSDPDAPPVLPWEVYTRREGDIFVFGPNVKSLVALADRVDHRSYRPSARSAVASSADPLSFLFYHEDELFETLDGDLLLVNPERLRRIARAVVRPEKAHVRTLN